MIFWKVWQVLQKIFQQRIYGMDAQHMAMGHMWPRMRSTRASTFLEQLARHEHKWQDVSIKLESKLLVWYSSSRAEGIARIITEMNMDGTADWTVQSDCGWMKDPGWLEETQVHLENVH